MAHPIEHVANSLVRLYRDQRAALLLPIGVIRDRLERRIAWTLETMPTGWKQTGESVLEMAVNGEEWEPAEWVTA